MTDREDYRYVGPNTGRGPRGYQRSDDLIREDVVDRLTQDGRIDARNIDVQVESGAVRLNGTVNSRQEKYLADDDAWLAPGVRDVQNKIKVLKANKEPAQDSAEIRGGIIRQGMDVFGIDGQWVGRVKKVYEREFLVDRSFAVAMLIPFGDAWVQDGRVILVVRGEDVHRQGYRTPGW